MGLEEIQDGFDVIEFPGASELVDEGGIRRVVVFVASFMEIAENSEEFVGILALFEMIEKRDGCSTLVSRGLVRPWFFCWFSTETAMDVIGLKVSV